MSNDNYKHSTKDNRCTNELAAAKTALETGDAGNHLSVEQRLFDNSKSRIYQSIQAPDSLQQKVLERAGRLDSSALTSPKSNRDNFRILQFLSPLAGVAACLCVLIVMSIAAINHFDKAEVRLNDTILGTAPYCLNPESEAAVAVFARFREILQLPLEINSARPVTVSVSDGILQLYQAGTAADGSLADGEVLPMDNEGITADTLLPAEGTTVIKQETDTLSWLLEDLGEDECATLTITINGRSTNYTVTVNESDGLWYIEQSNH